MRDLELFVQLVGYTIAFASPFVAMVVFGMASF